MTALQPRNASRGPSVLSARSGGHVGATLSHDDSTLHLPDEYARPSPTGGAPLSARQSSTTIARRNDILSDEERAWKKKEMLNQQKKKEHAAKHGKMLLARERDEAEIRDRAVRTQQKREQQFKDRLDEVRSNDTVRVEAAHLIQQFEMEQDKRKYDLWSQWDREVSQRIEQQLNKFMTRKNPNPTGPVNYRDVLLPTDDPAKRCLVQQKQEDNFRRLADSVILTGGMLGGKASLNEQVRLRNSIEEYMDNRTTTRPILPVEQWGQQELFAGPYGYFAQRCERMDRGESFHSNRRMGADRHLPYEADGVHAAGKKREKSRIHTNYNHMGALVGDHSKSGEAYKHKRDHGGGSAAPLQDHFFYEKGNDVVEFEFPVGRRCFPHLVQK